MMSDAAKHCFDRFRFNLALAEEIDVRLANAGGWSCVVRFYAALHLINAYLIDKENIRFDPGSTEHRERKAGMDQCPELRDAPRKYRQLKDLSESVRYDAGFQFKEEHQKYSMGLLDRIVAIVEAKINKG